MSDENKSNQPTTEQVPEGYIQGLEKIMMGKDSELNNLVNQLSPKAQVDFAWNTFEAYLRLVN
jgi:hypothetical protein